MIVTTTVPPIIQNFNKHLLADFLQRCNFRLEDNIALATKKIRAQDTGKRKMFDNLLNQYREVYVRKETEKNEYDRKVKEKIKERPRFPYAGVTAVFTRMDCG